MTATAAPHGQCSEKKALELTRELQQSLEISWNLLRQAFEVRAWAALGYESWESYCRQVLGTSLMRLSRELRREAVAELLMGDQPMSNRAIAAVIGVDEGTVRNDLRALAESSAPSSVVKAEVPTDSSEEQSEDERPEDEQPLNEEHEHEPVEEGQPEQGGPAPIRRVTGVDGKSYTTKPETKRRRRSLADRFGEDAVKLGDCADRLAELAKDDRFGLDRADLNEHYRQRLEETAEAIRTVIHALAEAENAG